MIFRIYQLTDLNVPGPGMARGLESVVAYHSDVPHDGDFPTREAAEEWLKNHIGSGEYVILQVFSLEND